MIVKHIEPTDHIYRAIKSISQNSDDIVLFSIDDIVDITSNSSKDVTDRIVSLIEADLLFDNRDDFSQGLNTSQRVLGLKHIPITPGKEYLVLGIEAGSFRVINDMGRPTLIEPQIFEVIDSKRPEFWITEFGEDGEEYSYPKEWMRVGFWEDYFDGVIEAVVVFEKVMSEKYSWI